MMYVMFLKHNTEYVVINAYYRKEPFWTANEFDIGIGFNDTICQMSNCLCYQTDSCCWNIGSNCGFELLLLVLTQQ